MTEDCNEMDSKNENMPTVGALEDRARVQESQQQLETMHRILDQTDHDLRRALGQSTVRRDQLDELHTRSEEMLSKNENLIFGTPSSSDRTSISRSTKGCSLDHNVCENEIAGSVDVGVLLWTMYSSVRWS